MPGHGGQLMRQGDGIALEAQDYPDSPNHPNFPTARLDPGQTYSQVTVLRLFTLPSKTSAKASAKPGPAPAR